MFQLAIKDVPHSSSKNTEITPHYCCCVLLHSVHESLCIQNLWDQASETSFSCDTCTGRRAIKFWGAQLYVTAHLYEQLLLGSARFRLTNSWWCAVLYHYFQKGVHGMALLSFFLHQIRSTTSTCSTCRMLGTAPSVPLTQVLHLGVTW
jgi:hypothetical protein